MVGTKGKIILALFGLIMAVLIVQDIYVGVTGGHSVILQSSEKESTTWYEVGHWEGQSIKNTEVFHIPSREWNIAWITEPRQYDTNFQIFVYTSNGALKGVVANVIGADNDSSRMYGSGDYYLTINTAQPYKVVVEAKK